MKKLYLVLLISPFLLAATAHKYYLSVTDVEYNEKAESLQIITRLFYDDLEDVLQERYDESIIVDATYDQEKLDRSIAKYIAHKMKIEVNGEIKNLRFLGKKFEDDYVVCYIEIPNVRAVKTIIIENTLLTDMFPDQKNMIHTKINGKKKSFLLTTENPKGLLNF